MPARRENAPPTTTQPNLSAYFDTLQQTSRTYQNSYAPQQLPQVEYQNPYGNGVGNCGQVTMSGYLQMQHELRRKSEQDQYRQSMQYGLESRQDSQQHLRNMLPSENITHSHGSLPDPTVAQLDPVIHENMQHGRDNPHVATNSHHVTANLQPHDNNGFHTDTNTQRQSTSGLYAAPNTQQQNFSGPSIATNVSRQYTSSSPINASMQQQTNSTLYANPTTQHHNTYATTGSQFPSITSHFPPGARNATPPQPSTYAELLRDCKIAPPSARTLPNIGAAQSESPTSQPRNPIPQIGYERDLVRRGVYLSIWSAVKRTYPDSYKSINICEPSPHTPRHDTVRAKINFGEWGQPPEHAIDRSPAGAKSIRDPLWGCPPVRVGRDPRYQQVSTHDGRRTYLEDAPGGGRV